MNKNSKLEDKILDAIKSGEIKMRPRWHFVLRSVLFALGSVLALLFLLYISSFIVFALQREGLWFAPSFGLRGIGSLLRSLPWLLILIAIAFIVLLEVLVRKFSFGYRKPLLYTALGVIVLSVVGGVAIASTPLHSRLSEGLYESFVQRRFSDVHPCTISEATDDGFVCRDEFGRDLSVNITEDTRFPLGANFTLGDKVLVFGGEDDGKVTAFGVRKIEVK